MRVVRRRTLIAGGCRTNVHVHDSLLLSLSRSDRRLAFGPQSLWSSPGNMFSSSSALFLLSRLQAPFVINVSQTFRQLLLPAQQFRVYINPSKSRCLITRQPFHFFGGLSKKNNNNKIFHSFVHSLRESCKSRND